MTEGKSAEDRRREKPGAAGAHEEEQKEVSEQEQVERLRNSIMERMDLSVDPDDGVIRKQILDALLDYSKTEYLTVGRKKRLNEKLFASIRGLDLLEALLEDDSVTEIMVNGADQIFVERQGKLARYEDSFSSEERLLQVIQKIVSKVNRRVNDASPIADARLPDGSRVCVVLPPVSLEGPVLSIRKFPKKRFAMDDMVQIGSITEEAAEFLKKLVLARYNIFISGGTGTGKTTFLNALSGFIPEDERIITIEDSAELQLQNIKNLIRLEVRQANTEGENAVTMRQLIRASLRLRPDRIVVGEVRGEEAVEMIMAMSTGHDGSLSTGHGNSSRDMMLRLETMLLMGMDMPLAAIRSQIAAGIDILVHLGRLMDKSRKVLEISEIQGIQDGQIRVVPLYLFREKSRDPATGRIIGSLERTGEQLKNRQKWKDAGFAEEELMSVSEV